MRLHRIPYVPLLIAIVLWLNLLTGCGGVNSNRLEGAAISFSFSERVSILGGVQQSMTELEVAQNNFDATLRKYLDGLSTIAQIPEAERSAKVLQAIDYTTASKKLGAVVETASKF